MSELKKTPLSDAHVRGNAKMVDFSGWWMPLQYAGITAEHKAVREHAGRFDVSHMGEIDFLGPGALEAVSYLVTNDVGKLVDGRAVYTVTCRPHGGIVDDCIVYRIAQDHIRIVVNAANIDKDREHFQEHVGDRCTIVDRSDELGLIAIQGPAARDLVARLAGAGAEAALAIPSFGFADLEVAGKKVTAARTGYTGEDGFELFVAAADATAVWDALGEAGAAPIGLGARDTLRLEARLCLYGNDIDETTNPIEAGLGWVVKAAKGDFVGKEAIVAAQGTAPRRRLIGFRIEEKAIARPGAEILGSGGSAVGRVTSGGPALTVGGAIGMGWAPTALAEPGTPLTLLQRDKRISATVVKGPFYRRPQ